MICVVKELFLLWNNNKIAYCIWKGSGHLKDAMTGKSDFDILVENDSICKAHELLIQVGYIKCNSQFGSQFPGVEDWIAVDNSTGVMVHIHLHLVMIAGHRGVMEYILPWNTLAFNTRVFDVDTCIFLLNPSLEIILLLTRLGIEQSPKKIKKTSSGYEMKENTIEEIAFLKEKLDLNICREMEDILFPTSNGLVLQYIEKNRISSNDIAHLIVFMKQACKKWLRYNQFQVFLKIKYYPIAIRLRFFLYKSFGCGFIRKTPSSGKGLTIAFIGQDGAGKTTITNDIMKWWSWKMDIRYYYFGSGDNYFSWKKSMSEKLAQIKFLKFFGALLALCDTHDCVKAAYRNLLNSKRYASKGGVAVYDRFPQIQFAGICDGPKIRMRLKRYFGTGFGARLFSPLAYSEEKYLKKIVAHQPNIVFKLILPPEESIRRKPHENFDAVKRKHEIIKSLRFDSSDVYTIDATMPFEEEKTMIKNIIWQHIQK